MDPDLWAQLTDPEKNTWKELEATINSPGFQNISRDLREVAEGLEKLLFNCHTWEQYQRTLGALEALSLLLNVEGRAIQQLQQAVLERQQEEPEEAPADAFI